MSAVGSGTRTRDDEEVRVVYRWRLEELLRAGYDRRAARLLAGDFSIDLHLAVDLPRRGCSTKVALRILL